MIARICDVVADMNNQPPIVGVELDYRTVCYLQYLNSIQSLNSHHAFKHPRILSLAFQ